MVISSSRSKLSGHIQVPGSKSHTIRALLLASLAEGVSHIKNPLPSADCLSASRAIPLLGASVDLAFENGEAGKVWTVKGAGKNIHLPDNVVDVGDSGSLLYFMSPIASTFEGWSIFTGDSSIRKRPVSHVVDALRQLGAEAYISRPDSESCPMIIKGPISTKNTVKTDGALSQYISGMMMAALRMKGTLNIELSNPKETPYLTMTKKWIESLGAEVTMSKDFKHISVKGEADINAFDKTIPSDWEGVAFPLIAALISDSTLVIDDVDSSGTQGDDAIVAVLQSVGADLDWDKDANTLTVRGLSNARNGIGHLSTLNLKDKELHVNLSGFPDAVCALATVACFIEGTTVLEDLSVCRKKETDRLKVLHEELSKLGAEIEEGDDYLVIHGHCPVNADGSKNPDFKLHGGIVESYDDHRIAMSFACAGLGLLKDEQIKVKDAECCAVSFPHFYEIMKKNGAAFVEA
ncbi:MAG: 3-phosphoshikimate 1-carboxyvinyltransferase [Treponema sp.]|nr:3-phosphoshikimate 1-carboxyvinyltransferase [Treponema sp.]